MSRPAACLQDMLMYRLYQAWSQSNPVFVRLCEGRYGITRREWRILAAAVEHGRMTSAALAAAASLDLVRTSRTVGALCRKGWLQREHGLSDRRVVHIEATEAGLAHYQAVLPAVAQLNDLLAESLDPAEIDQLRDLLARIEARGRAMAAGNLIAEKADRRAGGTRRPRETGPPPR
ncbi:winged helix DNA-binding domain protein [Bordetella bronchiseptica MBORD675]|uniref:MarR family winged helix-turn-helix transcriptional regulator n=1 Tax=Bordetella bronchiseptica TaxID=518 RepID=UPI00029020CF|nr:MarR family winged helix-turn-helix transcriptional regulator [Bordetella bronchiseptica]KCV30000.1 winged helix DNA-binding domain protein [Bordetella bronchiseptica 00-P-2730]AUL14947.1 DNA-binding protein [Bordetella bronchiseptica]AZW30340.1 MarR family transcriptional regulator [Bordetella bronchiseptica]KCV40396.1 winged helix DNA-binding domain protein [Bordetella bronchiseptica 345]KDC33309.1 winged helix DNA-binding domain protein [Bordetella bronchiseptica GA96-01]